MLKEGDICEFDSHPNQIWRLTGRTRRRGCQMHGDDVKTYGVFLRRRNSDIRPWSNAGNEFDLAKAKPVKS